MIFICFAGETRNTIVRTIIYHLEKLSIPYWYDNYNLILGDKKDKEIFHNGLGNSEYAIIVYSKKFFNNDSAQAEEKEIRRLYRNNMIDVFPILYGIKPNDFPECSKKFVTNIIYNEITESEELYYTLNQIIVKIFKKQYNIELNKRFNFYNLNVTLKDAYLNSLLKIYNNLPFEKINERILLLNCIFQYLLINKVIKIGDVEYKVFTYLIEKLNFCLDYDFKETEILSLIIYHYLQ